MENSPNSDESIRPVSSLLSHFENLAQPEPTTKSKNSREYPRNDLQSPTSAAHPVESTAPSRQRSSTPSPSRAPRNAEPAPPPPRNGRLSPAPPPPRKEKPQVPVKNANVARSDNSNLVATQESPFVEVSPFGTPPGSPPREARFQRQYEANDRLAPEVQEGRPVASSGQAQRYRPPEPPAPRLRKVSPRPVRRSSQSFQSGLSPEESFPQVPQRTSSFNATPPPPTCPSRSFSLDPQEVEVRPELPPRKGRIASHGPTTDTDPRNGYTSSPIPITDSARRPSRVSTIDPAMSFPPPPRREASVRVGNSRRHASLNRMSTAAFSSPHPPPPVPIITRPVTMIDNSYAPPQHLVEKDITSDNDDDEDELTTRATPAVLSQSAPPPLQMTVPASRPNPPVPPPSQMTTPTTRPSPPVLPPPSQTTMPIVPPPKGEFPDASSANRRPPNFQGTRGIHTNYDTRIIDVYGRYVCTTGFFTNIWDTLTGQEVMRLDQHDTQKCTAVSFKPESGVSCDSDIMWLGTIAGEIHEVDISTKAMVSTGLVPSRKEISRIYRKGKELWVLSDGAVYVYPPDESGVPNVNGQFITCIERLPKSHTFSLLVGDFLWYMSEKEIRIVNPYGQDRNEVNILQSPISISHAGDVTAGAFSQKTQTVYLGHKDGKISLYSSKDFAHICTVVVSQSKVTGLAMVGELLWAGFISGHICVYDMSTTPWTAKKEWLAHEHGVCALVLDPSSVLKLERVQVASLGVDNYIQLYDGMLKEDWLETRMQARDADYCHFNEISAAILTWNADANMPSQVRDIGFIRDSVHPEDPPDLIVFGFQELVSLENKRIAAKSFLKSSKKKEKESAHDSEHMSRQYRVWRDHLAATLSQVMPPDVSYTLVQTSNLVGLFSCVFVKHSERMRISDLSCTQVKRGVGGLHGNKGAVIIRFLVDDTSVCLVNCHLAAGQSHTNSRNHDIAGILDSCGLPVNPSSSARVDHFVCGGDGTKILDHEICILNGDLNYRIDSIPRNTVVDAVRTSNLQKLLERDQLNASRRKNPNFRLRAFREEPITFAPTYKYDPGTDNYDSSEKRRAPAWCDRILYRGAGRVKQLEYRRHEIRVSDHRPVSGRFKVLVKTIIPQSRAEIWELCNDEFLEEKRKQILDASIYFFVSHFGCSYEEALSGLTGTTS